MKNYYEVLQIEESAGEKEIKKAYIKLLRTYPPEKCPEEFKEIREAYEILNNAKTRAEYDVFSKYKDEIDTHMNVGINAMEEEDYNKAALEFKKILVLEPSLSFARNYLGLTLMYGKNLDEAIIQFEKVIEDNPENATYLFNLGSAYEQKEEYGKAEKLLIKAAQIDKLNPSIIIALSGLYFGQRKYELAVKVLRDAITEDGVIDFQDFIYFFELVEQSIYRGEMALAESIINEIEEILPDDKEAKEYVAWKFGKLAYQLFQAKVYVLSARIAERASIIDPDDESIRSLHKSSKELDEAFSLFDKLIKDESIIGPIKGPIYYYLFGDEMDEDELDNDVDENFKVIGNYIAHGSKEIEDSLRRLNTYYKPLYLLRKELFDDILQRAQVNIKISEQWAMLERDSYVVNSFKRLIALWLAEDISESERDRYFDISMKELEHESTDRIRVSLNRLKSNYRSLYDLNDNFFKKLENALVNDYSTNSSNIKSHNTSNQSSDSCFVATAAFGTPLADEINILRQWRDKVLINSITGRLFVKTYYKIGPYAAKLVERSGFLKGLIRKIIYRIIKQIANNKAISRDNL